MGYESRIVIVEKCNYIEDSNTRFAEVIAVFNLCCMGSKFSSTVGSPMDCYFYLPGDSNKTITEDKYGSPICEIGIDDFINYIEKEGYAYRRLKPMISLLYAFREDSDRWKNLTILHYGY